MAAAVADVLLPGAELDALDEAAPPVVVGDFTGPGRAEAAAAAAAAACCWFKWICWFKGKMNVVGPCNKLLGAPGGKAC